jgi:D-psicose/D-tagatose/L-ribulose 3-epimerase
MKIGMNLLLWTGFVTEADFPTLGKLKAAGFDGVELPLFDGNAEHYKTVRAELDRQGLACTTVTIMTPEANPISPDTGIRAKAVERLKWAVEMNHVLGSSAMCGPYHSPLGVFSSACSAVPARRPTRRPAPPTCSARPPSSPGGRT